MTPGCDSRGRNDVRGRGGPSGGSVGRVRLYNVTDDAVVDGPQSGGAGWAEGRDPAAARPPRRRGAADPAWRVGVRSVVQHGVDHAHQIVGGGKDPSRYPTLRGLNDLRRVQRRDATLHLPVQVHARRASWSVSVTWARPPRLEKFLKRIFRDLPGSILESDAPRTRAPSSTPMAGAATTASSISAMATSASIMPATSLRKDPFISTASKASGAWPKSG